MISMSMIFIYIYLTAYIWGAGICWTIAKSLGTPWNYRLDELIISGLIVLTVYAQLISLYGPVSTRAALGTLLINLVCGVVWYWKKNKIGFFREVRRRGQQQKQRLSNITGIILFLIFCAVSCLESYHFDTELYHAQAIRWIEEVGIVKGGANLISNLGYNSSAFAFQALFSFKWLTGQSYRTLNGVIACLLSIWAICTMTLIWERRFTFSDVFRVGILVVGYSPRETASAATDRITAYLIMYILAKWTQIGEEKDNNPTDVPHKYAFMVMVAAWLLTIKLSATPLLLLAILPISMFLKQRKWKYIVLYSLLAILIVSPYLIRNYILSGWLLYPYTGIDLFDTPWKVPKDNVWWDAYQIKYWGYGLQNESEEWREAHNMFEWIAYWYEHLSLKNKCFMLLNGLAAIIFPIWASEKKINGLSFLSIVISISTAFWLVNAPMIRYGQTYLYFGLFALTGMILKWLVDRDKADIKNSCQGMKQKALFVLCVGVCMVFLKPSIVATGWALNAYPFVQADYQRAQGKSFEVDGVTFWYPLVDDQEGYYLFPAVTRKPGRRNFRLAEHGNIKAGILPIK